MSIALYKSKQFLAPLIKIIVIVICTYVFYLQWTERPLSFDSILFSLQKLPWFTLPLMISISLSSWLVESKKWQYLIHDFYVLGFRQSLIQNLTAQAASFITPLRAGEFALKPLFFAKTLRKNIWSRILASNSAQMIITTILGSVGVLFYLEQSLPLEAVYLLISTAVLLCLLVLAIAVWLIKKWDSRNMTLQKWRNTLLYSLLRYALFASNWLLILWLLDDPSTPLLLIRDISVFYLAVSIIPVFQLFDIALKWSVAAYVFQGSPYNVEPILVATTLVWLTNSIVPTILGCALFPFQKLKTIEE
jgi:uncharacterized membrane protein YbhN (UPF0104 family)